MASLYKIDQEILDCIDLETGEIIDGEKLSELQIEREQKLEGVALWIKNLKSDAEAYKAEKDAFAEREKRAKEKAEKLSEWLSVALNGEKMHTNRVAISFRKSEAVEIESEEFIPESCWKVKKEISKTAVKSLLKSGENVPGCRLVQNLNIQIK